MNIPEIVVQRKAQRLDSFNTAHRACELDREGFGRRVRKGLREHLSWSLLYRRLPIIDWMRNYNVKEHLLADIIAGLTIAIFQVPQGMAYAMLAGVPPVYGLYTSFFPALTYSLMGTSKQASIGTFAIISLMTGSLVQQYSSNQYQAQYQGQENSTESVTVTLEDSTSPTDVTSPIEVASAVALLIGLYQIAFGLLRLGSLSVYLSKHLVSGFTCASACHVATSQLGSLFGVEVDNTRGPLGFIYKYINFFQSIDKSNGVTMAMSGSAVVILILFREVLGPKLAKLTRVPFPIELILVIAGTSISYTFDLNIVKEVNTVGEIASGFPSPSIPWRPSTLSGLASGSIIISIVCFSSSISMGKLFAQKYNYEIDANQELLAVGSANVFGSFFSCIPACISIARSSIQDSAGGKTQLVSLINCAMVLIVLMAMGPLLTPLPTCVLSAIILVSLKGMILQVKDFWRYFRVSYVDGLTWLVTFVAVILMDVDYGLIVGVVFAILTLVVRSQRPKTYLMGVLKETDVYVPLKRYTTASEYSGIKIFHFGGPLHFGNVEYFSAELEKRTGISIRNLIAIKNSKKDSKTMMETISGMINAESQVDDLKNESVTVQDNQTSVATRCEELRAYIKLPACVVLDCSAISFLDTSGVTQLKQTFKNYHKVDLEFYLAACLPSMQRMLKKDGFFEVAPSSTFAFPTLHDALLYAQRHVCRQEDNLKEISKECQKPCRLNLQVQGPMTSRH